MPAITLRPYQKDMIGKTRLALGRARRVLLQAPTGAGKTALATAMTIKTVERGGTVFFICHRAELVEGTSKTFTRYGIAHGIIAAGYPMSLGAAVQVCSIDTLKGRLSLLAEPALVLWDECHHIAAAGWSLVMDSWSTCEHVGLSATPIRLDGQGLDAHFDEIVLGPSVSWLIENGYLAPFEMYAPAVPDMAGVRRQAGDYARGESAERMSKPKLIGDAVAHWKRFANGLRSVAFCVNIKHSHFVVERFQAAGVRAAHLDGGTPKGERRRIVEAYAAGDLDVLSNVGLFGEGFDLAAIAQRDVTIDCVIDLNPTQSLAWTLQKWGRALRPADGKVAILFDNAGNTQRHGFPDDDREWQLGAQEKKGKGSQEGPPPPATCSECFRQIRRPLPPCCPTCGTSLAGKARQIEEDTAAELHKVDEAHKKAARAAQLREQAACQSLGELVALAQRRGYSSPMSWAQKVFGGRRRKAA